MGEPIGTENAKAELERGLKRRDRVMFRRGFLAAIYLFLGGLPIWFLVAHFLSLHIRRSTPTDLDRAKIFALLAMDDMATCRIPKFEFVFLRGGPDAYGSCAFDVQRTDKSPTWETMLLNWSPAENFGPSLNTRVTLIPWASELFWTNHERAMYARQISVCRARSEGDLGTAYVRPVDCIAFYDDDTSPTTLHVSVDGWLFLDESSLAPGK